MIDVMKDDKQQVNLKDWRSLGLTEKDVLKRFPMVSGVRLVSDSGRTDNLYPPRDIVTGIEDIELTGTSADQYPIFMPKGYEQMLRVQGKIVFLGNGLSTAPLIVADRVAKGDLKTPAIVVDIFSYRLLLQDLDRLQTVLGYMPYKKEYDQLKGLVEAMNKGYLNEMIYQVGSGNIPEDLKDAALLINFNGPLPTAHSLSEQLSMLALHGEWHTSYRDLPRLSDEEVEKFTMAQYSLKAFKGLNASMITRVN